MTARRPPRRRTPIALAVLVDVLRESRRTGTWTAGFITLFMIAAILLGSFGQAAVPFLVYGGL